MPGCRRPAARSGRRPAGSLLPTALAGALGAVAVAQSPPPGPPPGPPLPPSAAPAGFSTRVAFAEAANAPFVRAALALSAKRHLVAIGRRAFVVEDRLLPGAEPVLEAEHDISFVVAADPGAVVVGSLHGKLRWLDATTLAVVREQTGVPNTFDAVALPNGDLLLSANPNWPQPGSNAGIWHDPLGGPARELLPLVGPSAPLLVRADGDLVAAELGPIVPPPPGSARLLRFAAAVWQGAVAAGTTLSPALAAETAAGYDGLYDLVEDDRGRVFSSDPTTGVVTATAPWSLAPAGPWLDLGPARFATGMQFLGGTGVFGGFQPPAHSPALLIATTDFATWFELVRVAPQRPTLDANPAPFVPPGPTTLAVASGPSNGLVLWLATTAVGLPEQVVATLGGQPVWLAAPLGAVALLGHGALDAQGAANHVWSHPAGVGGAVRCQALVLGLDGDLGTSPPLSLFLLP